jgi:hypothetical protein
MRHARIRRCAATKSGEEGNWPAQLFHHSRSERHP